MYFHSGIRYSNAHYCNAYVMEWKVGFQNRGHVLCEQLMVFHCGNPFSPHPLEHSKITCSCYNTKTLPTFNCFAWKTIHVTLFILLIKRKLENLIELSGVAAFERCSDLFLLWLRSFCSSCGSHSTRCYLSLSEFWLPSTQLCPVMIWTALSTWDPRVLELYRN